MKAISHHTQLVNLEITSTNIKPLFLGLNELIMGLD